MSRRANGEGTINLGYIVHNVRGRLVSGHILAAERAIGKSLPAGAVVHHVDSDRTNNTPTNLVICPDAGYHNLLHQRQRALDACGNANWRKCPYCKEYDDPANMSSKRHRTSLQFRHLACVNRYNVALLARKGETSSTPQASLS